MRPGFPSERQAQQVDYRPPIDGLRGIAVLAVLAFHAFSEYVPGGFVGVDVFFVISGFLITSIIARQLEQGRFSFANFYARRIRRLFPALILVLTATVIVGALVLLPDELERLGKHVAAASLFAANFAFWRESGYFDIDAEFKPLLHLWSLGIEEQFYLGWPVLLVLLWRRRALLKSVLALLVVASFLINLTLTSVSVVSAFYLPLSRFWELGLGCLVALAKHGSPATNLRGSMNGSAAPHPLWNLLPITGVMLIFATLFLFDESLAFPGWSALLPTLGALLVICTPDETWFQRRVLGAPALVYVGLISYALYLWHWPILSFARILQDGPLPHSVRWAALALGVVLAALTYHFVELPVRRRGELRVNFGLATGAAAAGIVGIGVYTSAGIPERFDTDVQAIQPGARLDEVCRARFGHDPRINYCRTTSTLPPNVIVLGDSRAQAIYEAVVPLLDSGHSAMLLARGGCPPMLDVSIEGSNPNDRDCLGVWRTFLDYVREVQPQVAIVVGNGSALLNEPGARLSRAGAMAQESTDTVFAYGLQNLLLQLSRVSQVIHIGEIPAFESAPSCFLRPVRLPTTSCAPEIERAEIDSSMSRYNAVVNRMKAAFPQIRFVDSVPLLCTAQACSQSPPGGPVLYRDKVHLSPAGGRLLAHNADLQRAIANRMHLARAR